MNIFHESKQGFFSGSKFKLNENKSSIFKLTVNFQEMSEGEITHLKRVHFVQFWFCHFSECRSV